MSEKSICRVVRRPLVPARPPRTDETNRFRITDSPYGVRDHQHATIGRLLQPPKPGLGSGMLEVRAVECVAVEKDYDGVIEGHPVFRRVDAAPRSGRRRYGTSVEAYDLYLRTRTLRGSCSVVYPIGY